MSRTVLDASAVLALLNDEPGSGKVAEQLPGAPISAVNLAEVVSKLAEKGIPPESTRAILQRLDLEVHPFGEKSAWAVGLLRSETRSAGLSLGDRACLALGAELALPVMTTDRRWKEFNLSVEVRLLR